MIFLVIFLIVVAFVLVERLSKHMGLTREQEMDGYNFFLELAFGIAAAFCGCACIPALVPTAGGAFAFVLMSFCAYWTAANLTSAGDHLKAYIESCAKSPRRSLNAAA
jgi:hypothetical protein